jgi:hypothetical protein
VTEVYVSAASTVLPLPGATQDLRVAFPWLAASSGGDAAALGTADQAWFWASEWQEGEREADADIEGGRTVYFDSTEEFLSALDREIS